MCVCVTVCDSLWRAAAAAGSTLRRRNDTEGKKGLIFFLVRFKEKGDFRFHERKTQEVVIAYKPL